MARQRRPFNPHYTESPLHHLIGAPLVAVARANGMMAQAQTEFLLTFCFDDRGGSMEPIMISMSITRSHVEAPDREDGEHRISQITTQILVPLITIVPISSLAVDHMDLDFKVEVTSHREGNTETHGIQGKQVGDQKRAVELVGTIGQSSNDKNSSKASASSQSELLIKVSASPLPLPVGVTTLIEALSKSIHPVELPEDGSR